MLKKNLKKSFYLLLALFCIGLIGLFLALAEFNDKYAVNLETINQISDKIGYMEEKIFINKKIIENYDFLEYKVNAIKKKYPVFSQILDSVYRKSQRYGFNPNLILGIMEVESSFNPRAVSNRGAYGLMQINFNVWQDELSIDKRKIFDVDYNIDLGLKILKRYHTEAKGDIFRALHFYNNGYKYNNVHYPSKVNSSKFFTLTESTVFSNPLE